MFSPLPVNKIRDTQVTATGNVQTDQLLDMIRNQILDKLLIRFPHIYYEPVTLMQHSVHCMLITVE